jgi:hypothetical protein
MVHRCYNLPNFIVNRVLDVVLSTRLKHAHAVAGLWGAPHDRLGRFQAVGFSHRVASTVVVSPGVAVVHLLFVYCPALW